MAINKIGSKFEVKNIKKQRPRSRNIKAYKYGGKSIGCDKK
jgi:ribosomal protein S30